MQISYWCNLCNDSCLISECQIGKIDEKEGVIELLCPKCNSVLGFLERS